MYYGTPRTDSVLKEFPAPSTTHPMTLKASENEARLLVAMRSDQYTFCCAVQTLDAQGESNVFVISAVSAMSDVPGVLPQQ